MCGDDTIHQFSVKEVQIVRCGLLLTSNIVLTCLNCGFSEQKVTHKSHRESRVSKLLFGMQIFNQRKQKKYSSIHSISNIQRKWSNNNTKIFKDNVLGNLQTWLEPKSMFSTNIDTQPDNDLTRSNRIWPKIDTYTYNDWHPHLIRTGDNNLNRPSYFTRTTRKENSSPNSKSCFTWPQHHPSPAESKPRFARSPYLNALLEYGSIYYFQQNLKECASSLTFHKVYI